MYSWLKNLVFPLRTTLVTFVVTSAVIVILLTIGAIGYPSYSSARKSFRHLWEDLAKQVAQTGMGKMLNYFDGAPITLRFIDGLDIEEELDVKELEMLLDICYRALKENPEFVSV